MCSDTAAQTLKTLGIEVYRSTLGAPDSLLTGIEGADAVIHTAFGYDFSRFIANCEKDRQAILTMGRALQDSAWSLVITSGTLIGDDGSGAPARESFFNPRHPSPRTASESAGQQLLEAGVNARVIHLPQVHDTVHQGLLTSYIERMVVNRTVALRGEGNNRWSAVHVSDVTRLYVSAPLQGVVDKRYHAMAEKGIALCDIAAATAWDLNLPLTRLDESQVDVWLDWFAPFIALDLCTSSTWTHERSQWQLADPGLLEDLWNTDYQKVTLS